MIRNTDSGFKKVEGNLNYNLALLENMAFFTDAVWSLELESKSVLILHDRLNHAMVGTTISLEEARDLILYHVASEDVEMILSSLTVDYLKCVNASEEFVVSSTSIDGTLNNYRMVMSPEKGSDGNNIRLYLSFAFTARGSD